MGDRFMKRTALFAAVAAAFVPGVVLADMNYTNFEVSMIDVELDSNVDVDVDGFALAGSYELNDRFYIFGEWQDQSLDFGIDGRSLELGGGYTHSFSSTLDFVGTLSYVDAEVKLGSLTADDDGLAVGGGIRTRLADSFELDASLTLVDFDESGSDTGYSFGGRYYFNDSMALGASVDFTDNADTMRLGFRWEF
jgi:long-subunit fatty acid transport protein